MLHVASVRGHVGVCEALLAAGAKLNAKNDRGWTALDEAISLKDARMVTVLYRHRMSELKSVYKSKKIELIDNLSNMPDFKMQVPNSHFCHVDDDGDNDSNGYLNLG